MYLCQKGMYLNMQSNNSVISLDQLKIGQQAYILQINTSSSITRRLLDLGMTKGICIKCLLSAPLNDPREYLFRGTVIGIRNSDAKKILVTTKKEDIWV